MVFFSVCFTLSICSFKEAVLDAVCLGLDVVSIFEAGGIYTDSTGGLETDEISDDVSVLSTNKSLVNVFIEVKPDDVSEKTLLKVVAVFRKCSITIIITPIAKRTDSSIEIAIIIGFLVVLRWEFIFSPLLRFLYFAFVKLGESTFRGFSVKVGKVLSCLIHSFDYYVKGYFSTA